MIVKDHAFATFVAAALTIGSILTTSGAASADPAVAAAAAPAAAPFAVATVSLTLRGRETAVTTGARTVGDLFAERDIHPNPGETVSAADDAPIVDGMHVIVGDVPTGADAATAASRIGPRDENDRVAALATDRSLAPAHRGHRTFGTHARTMSPVLALAATGHVRHAHPARHRHAHLAVTTPVARPRLAVAAASGSLAARIVRPPASKAVVRGIGTYDALAHVAAQGFASAVHFAGSALHMIATAYTGGCYACSGITASGVRAGFGIIAVDPRVIPLGTKLFIPGYGKAVAGDTGGAILGNRVDLGFDNNAQAMQFGRRAVTVYVLR